MATFYLDTSAIAKRYKTEEGTGFLNSLFYFLKINNNRFYTSRHSIIEVGSVVMKLKRDEMISTEEANSFFNTFLLESEVLAYFVSTNSELEKLSVCLMSKYPLKASDALQLACALDVRNLFGSNFYFVCFDKQLNVAAEMEGINSITSPDTEIFRLFEHL